MDKYFKYKQKYLNLKKQRGGRYQTQTYVRPNKLLIF